jgi:ribonuclease H / adenosylcobalamin/alpha-ribazole phosphatase
MPLYFIRHGESEANERNQFAGRQDSPLTRLGSEQAEQAGRAIARKGLVFDEIHVSPLQRARFTAQKIAEVSGNTVATIHVSDALLERHFGLLQGRNKSLWKKVLGYRRYDELLHSPHSAPPDGETWQELYRRVRNYYEQVLLPASLRGHTILVVAHKYVVEMFALLIAGLAPEDYCDFKIPNSRPSSENDLRYLAIHVPQSVNTLGELLEIHLPLLMLGSAVLGVLVKLIIDWSLPPTAFQAGMISCLVVGTFFGLLYADPARLTGVTGALKGMRCGLLIRVFLGMGLLIFGPHVLVQLLGTFFLLPPATLVPTLALLWGGDYAAALRITLSLSVLSPLLLGASVVLRRTIDFSPFGWNTHAVLPIRLSALLILAIALALPALVAQWYRFRQPIKAGALSTNWGWIGGAASLPLAFLATDYFTPVSLVERVMTLGGAMLLGTALLLMAGAFGGLLLIAGLVKVRGLEDEIGRAQRLAATTPNVFLWSAMISTQFAQDPSSVSGMLVMWTVLIFFVGLVIREQWLVHRVRENIAIPLVSVPWSAVTAKIASLTKVTEPSSLEFAVTAKIASLTKVTEPSSLESAVTAKIASLTKVTEPSSLESAVTAKIASLARKQRRAQIGTEDDVHLPVPYRLT